MISSSVTSTITVTENLLIQITTALPRGCAALSGSGFTCYLNSYKFSKYCLSLPHHYEKTARGIVKYLSGPCRKLQYEEIDIYMFSIGFAWAELCSFLWSVYYIRNAVRFYAATYFLRHTWRHINYRYKRVRISRRGKLRFKFQNIIWPSIWSCTDST